jgi:tetratricopeptide (TPR) repeat protein
MDAVAHFRRRWLAAITAILALFCAQTPLAAQNGAATGTSGGAIGGTTGAALGSAMGGGGFGFTRTVPTPAYFATLNVYYDGDYRSALGAFISEGRGGIKNTTSSWIDSICYHTMTGECYYQLGKFPQAFDQYTAALQLYSAFYNWMIRVQFPSSIRPAGAGSLAVVPWGRSQRSFRLGAYPDKNLISQGQVNNSMAVMRGGVVQNPILFPINAQEIVRCTVLAMRRRRELMGPASAYDPLHNELIALLSRRPGQPNHWTEAWIDLQLGAAFAACGKDAQAKTAYERAIVAGGEYDHPLTSVALLELGRLALIGSDFATAGKLFAEATYSAVNYYDPGVLEEAFRWGYITHMVANEKGVYPLLPMATQWAQRQGSRQLMVSLMTMLAENACVTGQTKTAMNWINDARIGVGRGDINLSRFGARLNYVNALALFQQADLTDGNAALALAMNFQRTGSLWLFQIALADRLATSSSGGSSPRVAMEVYGSVLRDPTPADWLVDPIESLTVMMVPHPLSYETWFTIAMARKEHERALEIADLARRHRFYSSLEMGGRLLNLRWLLEGPIENLDQPAKLQRQDLLVRFAGYDQLSAQSAKLRSELDAMPLVSDDPVVTKTQESKLLKLGETSAQQEIILREMALRREPCNLVFPPFRPTKDVQKALAPGQALLAFFCTSNQTWAFLLTNDKYGYWTLASPQSIQRQVTTLLRDWGNFEQNKELRPVELADTRWLKPGREILELIMKDSKVTLPYSFKELVIVPDNILWYVPFEALQVPDKNGTATLITKLRVRYAPTVGLAVGETRPRKPDQNMAVVLGRLYPNDTGDIPGGAFEEIERRIPGAVAIKGRLNVPSGLYATLFKRLIVLAEIPPSEGHYAWSPIPLDHNSPGSTLASWFDVPLSRPDQIMLPGYHTSAENSLKRSAAGADMFYSVLGLMSTGARTVLISRWRTGGQSSIDLVREFAQELPHTTASDAWQRSVLLVSDTTLDPALEPRLHKSAAADPPKAGHPFFWAGFLVADTGAEPQTDDAPAAAPPPAAPAAAPPAAKDVQLPPK